MSNNPKILIIGEGATLAHVGRPLVIAKALAEAGYGVTFACAKRFLRFIDTGALHIVSITSIDAAQFVKRVTWGMPMFSPRELKAAIEEDRRLLEGLRPALVIGDMRWSLSVSARLTNIPYAAVSSAHWSPYATHQNWVLPAHPVIQHFGFSAMQIMFRLFKPITFATLASPSNRVRRCYGLPPIGRDMRRVNEDADFILFPDMPELHPTIDLPPTHHYIGPIHWAPLVALPEWWNEVRDDKPVVYVNLGSSGDVALLPTILKTLADLPVQIIAATAGRMHIPAPRPNTFLADYLPGDACMRRASLAITNGGSMSGYQALASGVPVLGIASHLDQSLSMQPIASAGAGVMLCAPYVTPQILLETVTHMLADPSFKHNASRLQYSPDAIFNGPALATLVDTLISSTSHSTDNECQTAGSAP